MATAGIFSYTTQGDGPTSHSIDSTNQASEQVEGVICHCFRGRQTDREGPGGGDTSRLSLTETANPLQEERNGFAKCKRIQDEP